MYIIIISMLFGETLGANFSAIMSASSENRVAPSRILIWSAGVILARPSVCLFVLPPVCLPGRVVALARRHWMSRPEDVGSSHDDAAAPVFTAAEVASPFWRTGRGGIIIRKVWRRRCLFRRQSWAMSVVGFQARPAPAPRASPCQRVCLCLRAIVFHLSLSLSLSSYHSNSRQKAFTTRCCCAATNLGANYSLLCQCLHALSHLVCMVFSDSEAGFVEI